MAAKRPLPQFAETSSPPAPLSEGSESDAGGRRHISSSVPRTVFSTGPEKAAMKKLKHKMTFSDQSATSSAKSTPSKVTRKLVSTRTDPRPSRSNGKSLRSGGATTDPGKLRHKSYRNQAAAFVPVSYLNEEPGSNEDRGSDVDVYASEGEIASSLTISSLLSKLDSVKNFLKEAEDMRVKFEDKKSEPGMMTQLNKLDKLIDQLQQQESGYLAELIRLTELDDSRFSRNVGEEAAYSEDEDSGEEEEESEGYSSDEDDQTLLASEKRGRERGSGSGEGSTLSLRAQVELEKQAEQELMALQKQKKMLTELLEKQKQIQELEAKQQALLEMKDRAEEQLREAEAKGLEIEKFAEAAAKTKTDQPEADESVLLAKLSELRAKKEKVDRITELFRTLREEEAAEDEKATKPLDDAAQFAGSAQATGPGGASELVVEENPANTTSPGVEELQKKLREAAEARSKLLKAQKLLAVAAQTELEGESEEGNLSWRMKLGKPEAKKATKQDLSALGGGRLTLESIMTDLTDEEPSLLERSGLSDYETKLSSKREEVAELMQERDKLMATHKRLLDLQKKMHMRQFLDDSMPQNTDQEAVSQTDLTAATWGGSTVQSDPEDTATSVSLPSEVAVDTTQESNLNTEPLGHGEGATIEQMGRGKTPPFSVTRHTPRTRPNVRLRTQSVDSTEATLRADKKIKMDPDEKVKSKPRVGALKNPLAASFKASFKSPPSPRKGKDASNAGYTPGTSLGGGQFGMSGTPGGGNLMGTSFMPSGSFLSEHTATLQNQLALTSHMCQQLLYGQNNLIRAVCERLDRQEFQPVPQVEEHMAMLQQYQLELEAYYHQLCESYAQLQQHQEVGGGPDPEEPVIPSRNNASNKGSTSQPRPSGPPGFSANDASAAYPPPHLYPPLYSQSRPMQVPNEGGAPASPTVLPPPPPPISNPYVSPGTWNSAGVPPPGAYHHHPLYFSPYYYNPNQMPAMGTGGVDTSPSRFQQDGPVPFTQPAFGSQPVPFGQLPSQPQGLFPRPFPAAPGNVTFGASFDGGNFSSVPTRFNLGTKEGSGMVSPSGVTGSSLQVNAPSSPPSVSMQPVSTNASGTGKTGLSAPIFVSSSTRTAVEVTTSHQDEGAAEGGGAKGPNSEAMEGAESMSSLPMSIPEATNGGDKDENLPIGFSALRDTIYSEVATLIANNENRPHFLVELFRELQMLSTDYLRQRTLYTIQDLVTRYLTEEAVTSEVNAAMEKQYEAWLQEMSEQSDSDSSVVRSKPTILLNRPSQGFDYVEAVNSASSVSTPPNEPFASSDLGETVIKLDKAVTHTRFAQPGVDTASPYKTEGSDMPPNSDAYPQALDEQIKSVVMGVIPLLKENIDMECNTEMIVLFCDKIVSMVVEQEKHQKQDFLGAFRKQLEVTIMTTMEKYRGKKLRECGEELLMDVNEVLLNELIFFKMMEDCRGHPQLDGDFRSITSQSTTENEDTSFAEGDTLGGDGEEDATKPAHLAGAVGGDPKMLDPAMLQVLSFAANLTLQEEEDTLGKSRDDSLATSWDPKHRRQEESSPSTDGQDPANVVELSVSESQPIDSAGSEDGGVRGTGRDPALPPQEKAGEDIEDRGITPPTPVAVLVNGHPPAEPLPPNTSAPLVPTEEEEEGNVSIGRVSAISTEEGTETAYPLPALSPPGAVALQEPVPQITTTLAEDDLEARMKSEQLSVEGVGGILSSLKEQDQSHELGLVGDENEMDGPVTSNGT